MAKSCKIVPMKRDVGTGELSESRLFNDIRGRAGSYADAVRIYKSVYSPEMKDALSGLKRNGQGEPEFDDLRKVAPYSRMFPDWYMAESIEREEGFVDKDGARVVEPVSQEGRDRVQERAVEYNDAHPDGDFVALPCDSNGADGKAGVGVEIRAADGETRAYADGMRYNVRLNARIRELMAANGMAVGALTELEERRGIRGVTEFDKARDAVDGIVAMIRIARGEAGEAALPEEFAHFAVRALGGDPIVQRTVAEAARTGVARAVLGREYERYGSMYGNDAGLLAEEAVGRLLAEALNREQRAMEPGLRGLFNRMADHVRGFFARLDADGLTRAAAELRDGLGPLARRILEGGETMSVRPESAAASGRLYSLGDRIERDRETLDGMVAMTAKRIEVYGKRNRGKDYTERQKKLLDDLKDELVRGDYLHGILLYLQNMRTDMDSLLARAARFGDGGAGPVNAKARLLLNMRDLTMCYMPTLMTLRESLVEEKGLEDDRYAGEVADLIDSMTLAAQDMRNLFRKLAMPLLVEWIRPYIGDSIEVPFGKLKGHVITAKELIMYADRDISFFDRWLDSMASSSDLMLNIFDRERKKAFERKRLRTIDDTRECEAAGLRLEERTGSNDQSFMFERDGNGRLTGRYISEFDYDTFERDLYGMRRHLEKKYGTDPKGRALERCEAEEGRWIEGHTDIGEDGRRTPKRSLYGTAEFAALNDAQKEFHRTMMRIKRGKDTLLPDGSTRLDSAIKIHKSLIERVRDGKGLKGTFAEAVRDLFVRRCDDTDLETKATLKDFEGREVQSLPVFYTKWKDGEDFEDLSTDVVSTMIAYCDMANNFDEMSRIIDIMELGRTVMQDHETGRRVTEKRGGRRLVERIGLGGKDAGSVEEQVYKNPADTRAMRRLDDFFSMQVYNRYIKDEGDVMGVEISKAADAVNQMTALHVFALNLLAGISNVATGTVMMRIESVCGEFFSPSNVRRGDAVYASELAGVCNEIGARVKTGKLALFDELFNVLQDQEERVAGVDWNKVSRFARLASTNTLYFLSNCGEHWMQNRTALSLADTIHFTADGGQITLWDAYETAPYDGKDMSHGAVLVMRRGLTDADGRRVVTREELKERAHAARKAPTDASLVGEGEVSEYEIIERFTARSAAINQRMHGIYDKLDRNALQQLALGRMAIMFRKWMKPSFNRRFESMKYNLDLGAWTEGYYITTLRFAEQLLKDIRNAEVDVATRWAELHPTERANIKRAGTEVAHFAAICAAVAIFASTHKGEDRKDMPWAERMLEYQLLRLKNEIGVLTPSPLMFGEIKQIMQTPMASINTFETTASITKMLWLPNWFDEIKAGPYRGHSSAYRAFMNSPLMMFNKTLDKWAHPERAAAFYKQVQ